MLLSLLMLLIGLTVDLATMPTLSTDFIEEGTVELFSAMLYVPAIILFFVLSPHQDSARLWFVPSVLFLFLARELDLDKAFTDRGVLSLGLYSGDAPIVQKLVGGLVVVFVLCAVIALIRTGGRAFWQGLRSRAVWAWSMAGTLVFLVATKSVDGLARKLAPFDLTPSEAWLRAAIIFEESTEMLIPVAVMLAMVTRWPRAAR